jgi:polyisoprenyl-phosphate glycosyltransferase
MSEPTLSVVLPCFNEGVGLLRALKALAAQLDALALPAEIVAVDDGSSDDTWVVLLAARLPGIEIRALRLSRNFGKEAAILAGLGHARGRAVVVMDADLEHPPSLLPAMVTAWREGAPIVNACKRQRQVSAPGRDLAARAFYALFRQVTAMDLERDSDFKLLDRVVVDALLRFPERVRFFRGLSRAIGFEQVDVEFIPGAGTRQQSTFTTTQLARFALRAVVSFSARPLRWLAYVGVAVALLALLLAAQTLYLKLSGRAAEGFPTVILLILGSTSLQLLGLGVLGEYLAAIYEESKGRPHYLIARVHRSEPLASQAEGERVSAEAAAPIGSQSG